MLWQEGWRPLSTEILTQQALTGIHVSPGLALSHLEELFSGHVGIRRRRGVTVMLVDEVDLLVTRNQQVNTSSESDNDFRKMLEVTPHASLSVTLMQHLPDFHEVDHSRVRKARAFYAKACFEYSKDEDHLGTGSIQLI